MIEIEVVDRIAKLTGKHFDLEIDAESAISFDDGTIVLVSFHKDSVALSVLRTGQAFIAFQLNKVYVGETIKQIVVGRLYSR